MAFWGIEIKPAKPYTHIYDQAHGRLHLSQAVLGSGSGTKKCIVKCSVGEENPVFLCSLLPDKTESCPLDLEFEEDDEVVFSVDGPRTVHLTGYYLGPSGGFDQDGEGDDVDSYGEDTFEEEIEESTDYDTEDDYDVDLVDDSDLEVFPSSARPTSGVRIEEIIDDEKPENDNSAKKYPKKVKQLSEPDYEEDDDDDVSQHQIVVRGTGGLVVDSEDEDGFPLALASKGKATSTNISASKNSDTQKTVASKKKLKEKKKKTQEDHSDQVTGLKRKIDAVDEDDEPESRTKESEASHGAVADKGGKSKKKKKEKIEKKIAEVNGSNLETSKTNGDQNGAIDDKKGDLRTDNMDHDAAVGDSPKEGLVNAESPVVNAAIDKSGAKKKKKNKNKNKKSKGHENDAEGTMVQDSKENVKVEVQPSKVRSFSNGLVIEELSMGKPDGKRASPGNRVSVHYIGRLKKNGQIFDSNIGQRPFRFRLGIGQVIKGWDVGVAGMRIGDKRRLTIPPSMGYGSKGAGDKIPGNAWLVFDVELADVM